ncbi:hypothetical protein [Pedobacter sp. WC2423]|uniref:hypothetical protein n=1 Tax=Pedobacter sp. WC2423 TaxID=3234142 RepID=UPI003466A7CC
MKRKTLKINKETVSSILKNDEMKNLQGGYLFSLINGCSHSLCVSHNCSGIGFTVGSSQCC